MMLLDGISRATNQLLSSSKRSSTPPTSSNPARALGSRVPSLRTCKLQSYDRPPCP